MAAPSYGLIATFDTTPDLYHAAEKVRDAGYRHWDCITPFPKFINSFKSLICVFIITLRINYSKIKPY